MMMRTAPTVVAMCVLLAVVAGPGRMTHADEADPKLVRELLERLEKVEGELDRLRNQPGRIPADEKDQKLLTLLETPQLAMLYYSPNGGRVFVARLLFVNLTPRPVTIQREQIELLADEETYKLGDVPAQVRNYSIVIGGQSQSLRNVQPAKVLTVPSGGSGATWLLFADLPRAGHIPRLVLRMNLESGKQELDVNEHAAGLLGLKVERTGPRGSLGLLTISGALNTINLGTLMDALDKLAQDKVVRAVIRWTDSASPMESQVSNWLTQATQRAGRGDIVMGNQQLPPVPAAIRELHLAAMPGSSPDGGSPYSPTQPSPAQRVHKTDVEAVVAALRTAYEVLPLNELLREIEQADPLTRAAAVAGGGGRLPADKLPLLLRYADDDDPNVQQAALTALRHFGQPQAIETLVHHARRNAPPTNVVAVESLAGSRYAAAHEALLKLLKSEPAEAKKNFVTVLARHPRPVWSETLYEFVRDPNSGVGIEGLRALVLVGHPRLTEVFEQALEHRDANWRNEAFALLVSRTDPESEELALRHTLEHLKNSPPTPPMNTLLGRTRDRRAVPLLLEQLKKAGSGSRSQLIGTLAQIGDESVSETLESLYPQLPNHEKTAALNALRQLKSPAFRELAGQALLSPDSSLVSAACQGLQQDGSPEAVRLLVEALDKSGNPSAWSYLTNALAATATPEAREALQKARESDDTNKRNYANNALRSLRHRSPGYQHIHMGQHFVRQEDWTKAHAEFTHALELDPDLPDAYTGRAHVLLKQDKHKEAKRDYEKALELDPWSSQAVTGKAILDAMDGEYEGAIKLVEDSRERFNQDMLFAYNTACVYGRALEQVAKDENLADREQKIEQYRKQALEDLRRSVEMGFADLDWMRKDPDLKPLHGIPEFDKLSTPQAEAEEDVAPPAPNAGPVDADGDF